VNTELSSQHVSVDTVKASYLFLSHCLQPCVVCIGVNDFCREVALKALMFGHVELDERWALTAAVFLGASEVSQKCIYFC